MLKVLNEGVAGWTGLENLLPVTRGVLWAVDVIDFDDNGGVIHGTAPYHLVSVSLMAGMYHEGRCY